MTINTDLLIAAPMLQDYLVDKDTGKPLANGIVSLYKDNARSFYKNWYYQTGIPGAYTWVALDNPMHLSSVGTIQDPNGNDVIPFYYPYKEDDQNQAEAYYITVYSTDENGEQAVLQFTRENFPFNPTGQNPTLTNSVWRNYIINNTYWRNIGSLDAMTVLDQVIAPSQHDGFTNGDIRFIKNVAGANDDLLFAQMTSQLPTSQTPNGAITPEFMINMQCTGVQVGETVKCIQYPISLHVKTLNSVQGTLIFYGQNVAGNTNNYVDLYFYQFLGTGALSQPDPILIQRITLNNTFQEFQVPFITPSSDSLSLGSGGDDALFLRVQYPLSALFGINHTKPQIYFSNDVPSNDFDTYDQVGAIIDSPRTGDYRTSINSFQPFGWVPANDGSIGSAASSATTRANADTWPLYNLIYTSVLDFWAPVSTGRTAPGNTTAAAYVDFTANKRLTITKNLGRVMAGLNPAFNTPATFTAAAATDLLTFTSTANLPTGMPIQFTGLTGVTPININTIYFVINISATTIKLGASLELANAGTPIDITVDGSGTANPATGIYLGEENHTLTVPEIPAHTHTVSGGGNQNTFNFPFFRADDQGLSEQSGSTGGGLPHNNMQPTVFQNVFLKL